MLAIPKNPLVTAVKQVSSYCFRPLVASSVTKHEDFVIERKPESLKNLSNTIRSNNRAAKSIGGTVQRRYAHTDVYNKMPSYEGYRKTSASTTMAPSKESDIARKTFTYMTVGVTAVTGVYAAKNVVTTALGYLAKTKDTLAMAQTEVDLTTIPEGKSVVVTWRCKPVFIRHRSAEEAEIEKSVDLCTLRHPQHDDDRTRHPNWLVVIGICTHLGCIPVANAGQFGGYYCPCHGSHYDVSGRIRKGPAPLNLEVPRYDFPEENLLVIG